LLPERREKLTILKEVMKTRRERESSGRGRPDLKYLGVSNPALDLA
jgi:hypothetical protein